MVKNKSSLRPLFSSVLAGIIFAGLFSGGIYVLATPPTTQYAPGDTLNPSCAVGSTNCSVTYPVPYIGATRALDLGAQNFLTTGNGAFGVVNVTSFTATTTSGPQETLKYNAANYATLTAASNGDLTILTRSGSSGGNINFTPAITGDFTLLSNSGTLVLGGTSNTNNENLKLDFETYSNKVAITSGTGVSDIDLGSFNLITTGGLTLGGSTTGTLVTRVKAGAASESDASGALVVDSADGRLYFRYGGAWHYVAQTAGFQIPDFETIDPVSGDQIKEGDLVLGMVNQTFSDKALHGVWVKWDSVKQQLLKELKLEGATANLAGGFTGGANLSAVGLDASPLLEKIKNGLFSLGVSIKDGVTTITNLAVQNFSAKTARIEKLEMVDSATGDIYCTWLEQGEWQKAKGECDSVAVAVADNIVSQQINETVKKAAQVAATQAAKQAGNQAVQEVKKQIQQEVVSQVQAEVKTQVQEQLQVQQPVALPSAPVEAPLSPPAGSASKEPLQVEPMPAPLNQESLISPETAPVIDQSLPPLPSSTVQENQTVPNNVDAVIQQNASALMDSMARFMGWAANAIIPKEVKEFSGMLSQLSQQTIAQTIYIGQSIPETFQTAAIAYFNSSQSVGVAVSNGLQLFPETLWQLSLEVSDATYSLAATIAKNVTNNNQALSAIFEESTASIVQKGQALRLANAIGNIQLFSTMSNNLSASLLRVNLTSGETIVNVTLYLEWAIKESAAAILAPLNYIASDIWRLLKLP